MITRSLLLTCLGALSFAPGCALLTKAEPVVPRYFTPELADGEARPNSTAARALSVRLGRVGSGSYLKERIVHRDSEQELGFYEDRRWTERPDVYLQRELEGSLFEEHGLRRALAATAPTLTAELVEFEEVTGVTPRVRLRVSYALHDEQTVFFERTFSIERPLPVGAESDRTARVAAGLGAALRAAVARITSDVVVELTSQVAHQP